MKNTLKQEAQVIFGNLKNIDVLYANPKGEFFTRENYAENSLKKGEKLATFYRDQPVAEDHDFTVEELEQHLTSVKEIPVVEELLQKEQSGKNRSTAITALNDKLDELKNAKDDGQS